MEKNTKQKGKKFPKWIMAIIAVAVIGVSVFIYASTAGKAAAAAASQNVNTITLSKTEISSTLSISGQVESSSAINVYSSLSNYPIKEILVDVGDYVEKGDVLARIDTANLEYDITQSQNNLANAQRSLETEMQNNQNSITNAQNSLSSATVSRDRQQIAYEKSLAELKDAEETMAKPFDSYTYDNTINDAKTTLERKQADLQTAEADLAEATNNFDDYTYQNTITSARNDLERKQADLTKAINDSYTSTTTFNSASYDLAINNAQVDINRKQQDYANALLANNNDPTAADVVTAQRKLEDAQAALTKAYNDLNKARNEADSSNQTAQNTANTKVNEATNAVSDAQRAYDKAVTDLERAKADAIETASDKVVTARNALNDATITYNKAVTDLQRAKEKAAEDNEKQLTTAKRNVEDAAKSLESSKLSVANAKNSLDQAKNKGLTGETSVSNQQIELNKLYDQLAKTDIVALESGTITVNNAKVGTNPSGIMFAIEDTNLLYVSAKVKEYNLKDVNIGQSVLVSTDATDKEVFEGDIIYISPKAVSAAGSTSVEFEIWVAINDPNENIKIGMNAFLEIVTESKKDVYAVPLSAIITNENGTFVRSQSGNDTMDIPVEIGMKTSTMAEISGQGITDGLVIHSEPNVVPAARPSVFGF